MHSSLPKPTKAQKDRFKTMQDLGCVPCRLVFPHEATPGDIHHITDESGQRISHDHTYCNCEWHHRGVLPFGYSERYVRKIKGPSMAKEPAVFHVEFGSDADLLEFQNELIRGHIDAMEHGYE